MMSEAALGRQRWYNVDSSSINDLNRIFHVLSRGSAGETGHNGIWTSISIHILHIDAYAGLERLEAAKETEHL